MTFGKIDKLPLTDKHINKSIETKKNNISNLNSVKAQNKIKFGTLKTSIKDISIETHPSLIYDSVHGISDYFIILLDQYTDDKKILNQLKKDLNFLGIKEYLILSSVVLSTINDKQDLTQNLLTFESDWRKYLSYKNYNCLSIVSFGRALRILIRSGDLNYYDFIDDQFAPYRFYCGSAYVNGPDKWIYPVPPIEYIYPFKEIGDNFVNYNTRFFRHQLAHIINDDFSLSSIDTRPINIIDASEDNKIIDALNALDNADILAIDTETSGFDSFKDKLGTVQMTADGVNGYFFEWNTLKNHKRLFSKVLRNAKRLVLANAKFDIRFLNVNGVTNIWPTDDTTLLAHAMNSQRPKGLKPNTWFWCGNFGGYDDKLDMIKKKMKVDNYLMIPKSILMEYAVIDPIVTWRQLVAMEKWCHYLDETYPNEKIPEWTIWKFYKEIMMQNLNVLIKIEMNGVFFDPKKIEYAEEVDDKVINEEATNMAKLWNISEDFEFSSTDKLGKLFESMGWPEVARNKKGVYSTSDAALVDYERLGCKGIKNLKRYRSFNVAKNTFCIGWRRFIVDHEDGTHRVHQVTNPFAVVSFRHAQNNPNFQQIAARGDIAHNIKNFFCNPPSHEIIEVEDENGNKWDNSEYLKVLLDDGKSVYFNELKETDKIIDYDKSATVYNFSNCWMY